MKKFAVSLLLLCLALPACRTYKNLYDAACYGGEEEIKKFLARGERIEGRYYEAKDFYCTPLMLAALYKNVKGVKFLLLKRANVNAVNAYYTTLQMACFDYKGHKANPEIVLLLLSKGARINARNYDKHTALHIAAGWGNLDVVKVLVENGANIHAEAKDKYSYPICRTKDRSIIKYLESKGSPAYEPSYNLLYYGSETGPKSVPEREEKYDKWAEKEKRQREQNLQDAIRRASYRNYKY